MSKEKVYVWTALVDYDYEGSHFLGVFKDKENAIEECERYNVKKHDLMFVERGLNRFVAEPTKGVYYEVMGHEIEL